MCTSALFPLTSVHIAIPALLTCFVACLSGGFSDPPVNVRRATTLQRNSPPVGCSNHSSVALVPSPCSTPTHLSPHEWNISDELGSQSLKDCFDPTWRETERNPRAVCVQTDDFPARVIQNHVLADEMGAEG